MRDGDLLPVVAISLQLPDLLLELFELDSLALTRLASGEGVPRSLHGDGVVGILHNDGRQRLVATTRVDTRDRRVAARWRAGVAGLAALSWLLNGFKVVRLGGRGLVDSRCGGGSCNWVRVWEEREPVVAAVEVVSAKVGRHIAAVVELGRFIVDGRRGQSSECSGVRRRHEGLVHQQVLRRDRADVGAVHGAAQVEGRVGRRREGRGGSAALEGSKILKIEV